MSSMFQLRGLSSGLTCPFLLQPGALGGKCYVLGAVLIRQQREASGDTGEVRRFPPGSMRVRFPRGSPCVYLAPCALLVKQIGHTGLCKSQVHATPM